MRRSAPALRRGACLAFLSAAAMLAAPAQAEEDTQLWTTGSVTVKLGERFRVSQEVVGRFSHDRDGLYEIESNTLLGYKIDDMMTVWVGYTHDPQYDAGDFSVMEHRAREQVTFDNIAHIGRAVLSARLRAEQRWREGVDGTGWRVRPYVKLSLPFHEGGKTALVLSHESFIDLNSTRFQVQNGYERMRNLIAISTPLSKTITAEIGYLNQDNLVRGGEDRSDHIASLAVSMSL